MDINKVSIAFICDDNYVIPTSVAITSMVENKQLNTSYHIYIIASNLSPENISLFKSFEQNNINIKIVKASKAGLEDLHSFSKDAICVASTDALLKFTLAELLPEEEKILYLDGDILILKDLSELYQIDLNDNYAGVVVDSGSLYYKHKFVQKVNNYFNSGVMLLNLDIFRRLNLKEKLIEEKKQQNDSNLMDQNVFNVVFNSHIKLLPIKYNFLGVNLLRAQKNWTINDINTRYLTSYSNFEEIEKDAFILHFSSKDKPWKFYDVYKSNEWYQYYLKSGVGSNLQRDSLNCLSKDTILVSIVIPVYNACKFLESCLQSALCQTLCEIEIICVDDGSTDNSLEILRRYEKTDSRLKITVQPNQGQSSARNNAVRKASGEYIYFLDSDDLITPNAMEELYAIAKKNNLDTLLFDGSAFFENKTLEEQFSVYKTYYKHKKTYKGIYDGKKIYSLMKDHNDFKVSPCLQFVKRDNICKNNIWFPDGIIHEDNYFFFLNLMNSKKVMCVPNTYFLRRVRPDSTMTLKISNKNIIGYYTCAKKILEFLKNNPLENQILLSASSQVYSLLSNVERMVSRIQDEHQLKELFNDPRMNNLNYTLFLPSLSIASRLISDRKKKSSLLLALKHHLKKIFKIGNER